MENLKVWQLAFFLEDGERVVIRCELETFELEKEELVRPECPFLFLNVVSFRYSSLYGKILIECEEEYSDED